MKRKIKNTNVPDLSRSQWEYLIKEWVFSERDRHIISRYLFDDVTFEELAEEVHLSVRHTKTITYRAFETLTIHCTKTAQTKH